MFCPDLAGPVYNCTPGDSLLVDIVVVADPVLLRRVPDRSSSSRGGLRSIRSLLASGLVSAVAGAGAPGTEAGSPKAIWDLAF
jgi:hypothetical protein